MDCVQRASVFLCTRDCVLLCCPSCAGQVMRARRAPVQRARLSVVRNTVSGRRGGKEVAVAHDLHTNSDTQSQTNTHQKAHSESGIRSSAKLALARPAKVSRTD